MKIEIAKISLEIIKFTRQISNNSANKVDELYKYKKRKYKSYNSLQSR